jgi:hypothetical protein
MLIYFTSKKTSMKQTNKKCTKLYHLLVLFFSLQATQVLAQPAECYTDGSSSAYAPTSAAVTFPCVPSRDPASDFSLFYGHQENYRPVNSEVGPMYVHKTIKVLFHVMQPSISGGTKVNYENNPTDKATIQAIVDKMNSWLSNVPTPAAPIYPVCGPAMLPTPASG